MGQIQFVDPFPAFRRTDKQTRSILAPIIAAIVKLRREVATSETSSAADM